MVRRGWSPVAVPVWVVALAVATAAVTGCSDDGDGDGPGAGDTATTAAAGPATVPEEVEAGTGYLVLDGEAVLLTVRACELEPVTDPATGVVTELAIDADDGIALAVSLTRSLTPGDVPTRNDVIVVADQSVAGEPEIVEAERAETGGRFIDLLADGAIEPLLQVDGQTVTGEGSFGPVGARPGAEGVVEGSLIVTCPPAD